MIDRFMGEVIKVIGIGVGLCGIGGLIFTASVLSYRLLEWMFG